MKDRFYHDYTKGEILNSTDIDVNKKLQNILTLHPLKTPQLMLRAHQLFLQQSLSSSKSVTHNIKRELGRLSSIGLTQGFL